MDTLTTPEITSLDLLHRGKVRHVYAVDEEHLLMVATDRVSVYDEVLPDAIPGKGRVLNQLSCFWFNRLRHLIPNHLSELSPENVLSAAERSPALLARSVVVRRLRPIPYEAVVRGYLFGSAWRSYQNGTARDELAALPAGMQVAQKLPAPMFTPTTKAAIGDHDEMVDFARMAADCGSSVAGQIRDVSLSIYRSSCPYALRRGLIIADAKLEFGLDKNGRLTLMDELLTPDSSRFWLADQYRLGISPPNFDKQHVRDYMDSIGWPPIHSGVRDYMGSIGRPPTRSGVRDYMDSIGWRANQLPRPPAEAMASSATRLGMLSTQPPRLPAEVIASASEKYRQAAKRLMG